MKRSLAIAALILAAIPAVRASIVFVAPTAATPGSMTITAPISFTLSAGAGSNDAFIFVFQNFVPTSDGSQTFSASTPRVPFTINGSAAVYGTGAISSFVDNSNVPTGSVGSTDGYLFAAPITNGAAAGNIVTLAAGTYSLAAAANFNPLTTQIFTGNAFITSITGARISDIVSTSIPEPSTWALALGGAGLLGLMARRRRGAKG